MLSQQPALRLLIERESKARAADGLGERPPGERRRLESPTSLPQSSGTQAERGDPSESLPGLLGRGGGGVGGAQSVLTDDTSSNPCLAPRPLSPHQLLLDA